MKFTLYHLSRSTNRSLSLDVEFPSKYDNFTPLVLLRDAWILDNRQPRKSESHIQAFRKFEKFLSESDLDISQTRIKPMALSFIYFLKSKTTDFSKQEREIYTIYNELFRPIKKASSLHIKRGGFNLDMVVEYKRMYQDVQECRPQKFRPRKKSNVLLDKVDQYNIDYEDCLDGIRLYSFYVLEKFSEFREYADKNNPKLLNEIVAAIKSYPEASRRFLGNFGAINSQEVNEDKAIEYGFKSLTHLRIFYRRIWAKFFIQVDLANVVLAKELMVLQTSSSIEDSSHFPITIREFPILSGRITSKIQRGNKETSRCTKYFVNSILGRFSRLNSSSLQSALLNVHLRHPLTAPIPSSEYLKAVEDICEDDDLLIFNRSKSFRGANKNSRLPSLGQFSPLHLVSPTYLERAALYWYLSTETVKGETLRKLRLDNYFETKNEINFQEYKARSWRPFSQGPWHRSTPNFKALKRFQKVIILAVDAGLFASNPYLFSVPDPLSLTGKVPSRAQALYFPRTGRHTSVVTGNAPCIFFPSFENSLTGGDFKMWLKLLYNKGDSSLAERAWSGFSTLASIELRNAAELYVKSTVTGKTNSERRAYLISSNLSEMKVAASQPKDPHESMKESELTRMLRAHSNSHSPKVEVRDYIQHKTNARYLKNNSKAQEMINNEFLLSVYALNGKEAKMYTLGSLRAELGLAPAVELDFASVDILKETFGHSLFQGFSLDESGLLQKQNQIIFMSL